MGKGGMLRGKTEPPCVLDGLVYVLAVFPVLVGGTFGAHVAAVLVVIGFRYAATLEELLCPQSAALARTDGLRHGKHHVTDAEVLLRAYRDIPCGRLEVHEVHEVAARNIVELVFVAYPVYEHAQAEVNGVRPCGGFPEQCGTAVHGLSSFILSRSLTTLSAIPLSRDTSTSMNTGLKHHTQK